MPLNFAVLPQQWLSCFGLPIVQHPSTNTVTFGIPLEGNTYITQTVGNDGINYCQFGLRVNLTVQGHDCAISPDSQTLCGGHGSCRILTYNASEYTCTCDYGYHGDYCEELDACSVTQPCMFGGTCQDVIAGAESLNFTCECASGYSGMFCC